MKTAYANADQTAVVIEHEDGGRIIVPTDPDNTDFAALDQAAIEPFDPLSGFDLDAARSAALAVAVQRRRALEASCMWKGQQVSISTGLVARLALHTALGGAATIWLQDDTPAELSSADLKDLAGTVAQWLAKASASASAEIDAIGKAKTKAAVGRIMGPAPAASG